MRDYFCGKPKEGVADRVDAVLQVLNLDRVCVDHTAHDNINFPYSTGKFGGLTLATVFCRSTVFRQ
jgi:hypothetical protein